jgi:hypothetical protein
MEDNAVALQHSCKKPQARHAEYNPKIKKSTMSMGLLIYEGCFHAQFNLQEQKIALLELRHPLY